MSYASGPHPWDRDLDALQKLVDEKLHALHIAIDKQDVIVTAKFMQSNAYREQMDRERDEAERRMTLDRSTYMRADISTARWEGIAHRLEVLETVRHQQQGAMWLLYVLSTSGAVAFALEVLRIVRAP